MGLLHTWGEKDTGGCDSDKGKGDQVADTPFEVSISLTSAFS